MVKILWNTCLFLPQMNLRDCNEGVLEWVEKERISELNLWEGDRIFFRLLEEREDFFSLKLVYDTEDVLIHAVLDGKELALQNGIV